MMTCMNCIPGSYGRWGAILVVVFLVGIVLEVGIVALLIKRRLSPAIVALAVAVLLAMVGSGSARFAVTTDRTLCGSALAASRMRGVPTDAALDRWQLACQAAGTKRVHTAQQLAVASSCAFILAMGFAAEGRRRRVPLQGRFPSLLP